MGSRDGGTPPKKTQRRGSKSGPESLTDALRKEAERGWAAADRKTTKGRRRRGATREAPTRKSSR